MSRHVALTAIAALVALLVAPSIGLSLWIAAGIVVLVSFLAYALSDPPPRYRRHGWGQIQQTIDHYFGRFGRDYPEDRSGLDPSRVPGRNDPCPCGSGRKYKQCCGRPQQMSGGSTRKTKIAAESIRAMASRVLRMLVRVAQRWGPPVAGPKLMSA